MLGTKLLAAGLGAALAIYGLPAETQFSQSRTQQIADEIARTIRDTAQAVGTVQEALYESVNGIRYQGPERFAVERCAAYMRRYGRLRVQDVRPYKRRSWRVYGTVDTGGHYDRYSSRASYRAFTCTVRDDGRVKLKPQRLR